jgi:hypothetical protein
VRGVGFDSNLLTTAPLQCITNAEHFLILEVGMVIRAFIVASSVSKIVDTKEAHHIQIRGHVCSECIIVDRCVSLAAGEWPAEEVKLYSALFQRLAANKQDANLPIYTVLQSASSRSILAAERSGFTKQADSAQVCGSPELLLFGHDGQHAAIPPGRWWGN